MANPARGEVAITLDGRRRDLRLTLGALAELEESLDAAGLAGLAERFETGAVSARDLIRLIGAGLRGAGGAETDAQVAAMDVDGGASAAARAGAELLARAFAPLAGA